ncbi:MAG: hypothetical protein ACE5GX_17610 [Thermoanaerobaculia bacterium]
MIRSLAVPLADAPLLASASPSTTYPKGAYVRTGRWQVTFDGAFSAGGLEGLMGGFRVVPVPTYGCLDQPNPLLPFLSKDQCRIEYSEPAELWGGGLALSFEFECSYGAGGHEAGDGSLSMLSPAVFEISFISKLVNGDGVGTDAFITLKGERFSECQE